jgi:Fe-S-cluster containining protein
MMKCSFCDGRCCYEMWFRLENEDHIRWAKLHGLSVEMLWGNPHAVVKQKCLMVESGKCTIHETKPHVCKDYQCGDEFEHIGEPCKDIEVV